MRDAVKIGILYSTTGPYGAMGRDGHDGAQFAIEELQAAHPARIEPVFVDPHANIPDYLDGARAMLRDHGCRHIIGTITSLARKEVIPLVEKHDALLWYMVPYEGFEANDNVVYIGGCPNQHLLPLFNHLIPRFGARPFLLGANYVWGWEMNRLARELAEEAGGEVVGERCLPLEETDVARIVAEIEQRRPSFILNNLVGPSSFAFLAAMKVLGDRDPAFLPQACPVVSCDLTECELPDIGKGVATGQLAAAAYFDSLMTPENIAFKRRVAGRFGSQRRISSVFACAYASVKLCVDAIAKAGTDEPQAVRALLSSQAMPTLLGPIRIDAQTRHANLPFHLGRINDDNGFDIIASQTAIDADPYLTGRRKRQPPQLRIVS